MRKLKINPIIAIVTAAMLIASPKATATDPTHWTFKSEDVEGGTFCYAYALADKAGPPSTDEGGTPKAFITAKSIQPFTTEFSVMRAPAAAPTAHSAVFFGEEGYLLGAVGSNAWIKDKSKERQLFADMQQHKRFELRTFVEGKLTKDLFSLVGFNEAVEEMKAHC